MEDKHHRELEGLIQRELDQLPELQAPSTLIPRVIAAIHAKANAPWWQQPWLAWPLACRITSLVLMGGIPLLMFYGAMVGSKTVDEVVARDIGQWFTGVSMVIGALTALAKASLVILKSIQTPWLLAGIAAAFVIYLGCVGIGSLCFHLTFSSFNRPSK